MLIRRYSNGYICGILRSVIDYVNIVSAIGYKSIENFNLVRRFFKA